MQLLPCTLSAAAALLFPHPQLPPLRCPPVAAVGSAALLHHPRRPPRCSPAHAAAATSETGFSTAADGMAAFWDAVCSGGTGGGLTVFVDVGAGASTGVFAGLVLTSDGVSVFVGLHVEVGVTGASGAGGLETEQPMSQFGNEPV